jgi:hypothetical protein
MKDLEKIADLLIEKHKPYVNGYIGSSMLTNTEYPEQITRSATHCAIQSVNHTIEVLEKVQKECDEHRVVMPNLILVICEQLELKKILEQKS